MYSNLQDYLQTNPETHISSTSPFIDHMLVKVNENIKKGHRCLLLALTKKSSEEITNFMLSKGYKTFYLHSEIDTIDRWKIVKKLKTGEIDVLVGVNLLREGIDLPEVGFIAILDADKEGFLRSTTALIQNIGRAARNPDSEVVLYANQFTESIIKSLYETYRRRNIQQKYNEENNIIPSKAISNVKDLKIVKSDKNLQIHEDFKFMKSGKRKKLTRVTKKEKVFIISELKKSLDKAIKERRFEDAAFIRDQLKELTY